MKLEAGRLSLGSLDLAIELRSVRGISLALAVTTGFGELLSVNYCSGCGRCFFHRSLTGQWDKMKNEIYPEKLVHDFNYYGKSG